MATPKSTVIVNQYQEAANVPAGANSYAGLRIHAAPGLHDFLGELAARHFQPGSTVLDLAAGSGAMSMRLKDLGYAVHATDYVNENFRPREIPFTQVDLNEHFADLFAGPSFQAIMASEIIEHLENPRHFLRECRKVLVEEGLILLSTPNTQSSGSLAAFVRSGEFHWFSDRDYRVEGHITPITHWQMGHMLREAGFRAVWTGSFGDSLKKLDGSPRLKMVAKILDRLSAIPVTQRGEIYVCVAQKHAAPTSSA